MANKIVRITDEAGNRCFLEPRPWKSASSWSAFTELASDIIQALENINTSLLGTAEGVKTGVETNTGGAHYGYIVYALLGNYYSGILLGYYGASVQFRRVNDVYYIREI